MRAPYGGSAHVEGARPSGPVRCDPGDGSGHLQRVPDPSVTGRAEPDLQTPRLRVGGEAVQDPQVAEAAVDEPAAVAVGVAGIGVAVVGVPA